MLRSTASLATLWSSEPSVVPSQGPGLSAGKSLQQNVSHQDQDCDDDYVDGDDDHVDHKDGVVDVYERSPGL